MSNIESNFSEKIQIVTDSLKEIIKKFQMHPANFFFEEDIRALLFVELYNKFQDRISVPLVDDLWFNHYKNDNIEINPVRSEYGKDEEYKYLYGISDIDIAIISNQNDYNKGKHNYHRFCDIIIELKYSTENFDSKHAGFINDFLKIKNVNKIKNQLGIAMCFDLHKLVEKSEQNFVESYWRDGIKFDVKEVNKIHLSEFKHYAVYVTPNKVYVHGE